MKIENIIYKPRDPSLNLVHHGLVIPFDRKAKSVNLYLLLSKHLKVNMQELRYTHLDKSKTIMISVWTSCRSIREINDKLIPDEKIALHLGMNSFPDRSQVNRYLAVHNKTNTNQLRKVHKLSNKQGLLELFSQSPEIKMVFSDLDATFLIAEGDKFELSKINYKGKKSYLLSMAFISDCGYDIETALYLNSGNTHCNKRFKDLVDDTLAAVPEHIIIIFRTDAGYGNVANVIYLQDLERETRFLLKGNSDGTTNMLKRKYAKEATWVKGETNSEEKQQVQITDLGELTMKGRDSERKHIKTDVQVYLVRTRSKKKDKKSGRLRWAEWKYSYYMTNLSKQELPTEKVFIVFQERQDIEGHIKEGKNAYFLENIRCKKFYGNYAFLLYASMAHNIMSLTQNTDFQDTPIQTMGKVRLTQDVVSLPVIVEYASEGIIINAPPRSVYRYLFEKETINHKRGKKIIKTHKRGIAAYT